jgi:hypothetical protein
VPLARAAGLRFQGLTFSYLVLRRDGQNLTASLPPTSAPQLRLRVISERIVTKGKSELFACTEAAERIRLRRLDRDRSDESAAWDELGRGDVAILTNPEAGKAPIDDRGRVAAQAGVDVWRAKN